MEDRIDLSTMRCWPALAVVIASFGCAHGPDEARVAALNSPPVAIRVEQDTVALMQTTRGAGFFVTATLRNDSDRLLIHPGSCGQVAQRRINDAWTTVWLPICLTTTGGFGTVAPHDSVRLGVNVYGFTDSTLAPKLDPRLQPGVYRLLFSIGFVDGNGVTETRPMDEGASTTFVVK